MNSNGFSISTDKEVYVPGDTINGVMVVPSDPSMQAEDITVILRGKELCLWSALGARTGMTKGENIIFEQFVVVHVLSSGLVGGAFPFSTQLPAQIPPSCNPRRIGLGMCSITYTLEAVFRKNSVILSQIPALKIVHVRPPPPVQEPSHSQSTTTMTSCGCFGQGELDVELNVDESVVAGGSCVTLKARIDNRSTRNIKSLVAEVYVVHDCQFRGTRKIIPELVAQVQCAGINAMSVDTDRRINITLPTGLGQTTTGAVVKVSYSIILRSDNSPIENLPPGVRLHVYEPIGMPSPVLDFYTPPMIPDAAMRRIPKSALERMEVSRQRHGMNPRIGAPQVQPMSRAQLGTINDVPVKTLSPEKVTGTNFNSDPDPIMRF